MFRLARGRSRFGYVPVRLVACVLSLFALLLAISVIVGMQYERQRLGSSGALVGRDVGLPSLLSPPGDVLKVLVALLSLAAVGIVFFTTVQNYRVMTQTFERVTSRMRTGSSSGCGRPLLRRSMPLPCIGCGWTSSRT